MLSVLIRIASNLHTLFFFHFIFFILVAHNTEEVNLQTSAVLNAKPFVLNTYVQKSSILVIGFKTSGLLATAVQRLPVLQQRLGHKFDHTVKRSKATLVSSFEQRW